jgi:putative peptide zinc metalloprotease protein
MDTSNTTLASWQVPRLRPDIVWIPYADQGRWVAFDSIASNYYYFDAFERDVVRMLDGTQGIQEIVDTLNMRSLKQRVSSAWVHQFLMKLAHCNLLLPGYSLDRPRSHPSAKLRGRWWIQALANPLAIRIPLLRSVPPFSWARWIAAMLWSPVAIGACFLLLFLTMTLVLAKVLHDPSQSLRSLERIQGDRWIALVGVYVVIKSLHELGHYLACVRWKVLCKEVGVLFLFFAPSLYCDTTDAWKLQSKWQRAAIAAAGMYVELWIAAIAGIVFLNTHPGLAHTLAAEAMIVCTLSTLVVNGNPFFRYDGYYIMSDLWGVPNLAGQCNAAMWQTLIYGLGGKTPDASRLDRPLIPLLAFGVASGLYRIFVLFVVVGLVWNVLIPNGLGPLAVSILAVLAFASLFSLFRFFRNVMTEFFTSTPIRPVRFLALVGALGLAVGMAFWAPLPLVIRSRGFVDANGRIPIYCQETAELARVGAIDQRVQEGDLLFQLVNADKNKEQMELQHEIEIIEVKRRILEQALVSESAAAFEMPTLKELQNELEAKHRVLLAVLAAMEQRAPADGWFYPSPMLLTAPLASGIRRQEVGHAIEASKTGMSLERGTLLGWFGPESGWVLHAVVSQRDARWVRGEMESRIVFDAETGLSIPARVRSVSTEPLSEFPRELQGDPSLIGMRDERGKMIFESPHYLVLVEPLVPLPWTLRGMHATLEFPLADRTLARLVMDTIAQSFDQHSK